MSILTTHSVFKRSSVGSGRGRAREVFVTLSLDSIAILGGGDSYEAMHGGICEA